jgi:hypothetical protein
MFISNKTQRQRINMAVCTNYYSDDFNNGENDIYRIFFDYSSNHSVFWQFSTWEERDKELREIDILLNKNT